MMDHLDQHLKDTQERLKVTAAEMEASLHRLEQAVEEGRQRLLNLLEEANADIAKLVSDAKTLLMRQRGKLTTHRSLVEHACGMTSPDVVGGMASSMRSRVNDLSCSATLPEDTKVFSKVKLVIDPKVMSWIESEISRLGKVEVIPGMMPEISELGSKVIPVDDIAEVKVSVLTRMLSWFVVDIISVRISIEDSYRKKERGGGEGEREREGKNRQRKSKNAVICLNCLSFDAKL